MGKINLHTIEKVEIFVSEILATQLSKNYIFHSKAHTLDVVKNVEIIGNYDNLEENDINILKISAFLHDVGYSKIYNGHEKESAVLAEKFLRKENIDESEIERVITTILATKVPQKPKDKLSEMLCDADLMHFTYDDYFEYMELLRGEWKRCSIANLNEKEFDKNTVSFFNSHTYFSKYGIEVLKPLKEKTLLKIKNRINCYDSKNDSEI